MKNSNFIKSIFLSFALIFNITILIGAPNNKNSQLNPVLYTSVGGKSTIRNNMGQTALTTTSRKNGPNIITTTYRDKSGRITQTSQKQVIL